MRETDVYLRDLVEGKTTRVSKPLAGGIADADSEMPVLSSDGATIAFVTNSLSFVPRRSGVILFRRDKPKFDFIEVDSQGRPSERQGREPSLSGDGSRIAFVSDANDLVPNDTNGCADTFVRDFKEKWTRRVSVASDGSQAHGEGTHPKISADGNRVVFVSNASNLVPDDRAKQWDVFVHDIQTKRTLRTNVSTDGTESNEGAIRPAISADGVWVTFDSTSSNLLPEGAIKYWNVFIHNVDTGLTERVTIGWDGSEPNERSGHSAVSGDGRFVTFTSSASNLVPWDENGVSDVFVWDRLRRRTIRVSREVDMQQTRSGSNGASISADGRYVLFSSGSLELIQRSTEPFKYDRPYSLFIADLEHAWDDEEQTSAVENAGSGTAAK